MELSLRTTNLFSKNKEWILEKEIYDKLRERGINVL